MVARPCRTVRSVLMLSSVNRALGEEERHHLAVRREEIVGFTVGAIERVGPDPRQHHSRRQIDDRAVHRSAGSGVDGAAGHDSGPRSLGEKRAAFADGQGITCSIRNIREVDGAVAIKNAAAGVGLSAEQAVSAETGRVTIGCRCFGSGVDWPPPAFSARPAASGRGERREWR